MDIYLRSTSYAAVAFVVLCTLPILAKWLLIGRWKPQQIPIWSLAYFRFWLVKTLVRSDPLVLFVGSPLYVLYLRALGAKVGQGVLILSPQRADLHRPAHHRRRHGHPQGLVLLRLPRPRRDDPDRFAHPGQGRAGRRDDGVRHRHLDGRRGPARSRILLARRPVRAGRPDLARVPGPTHHGRATARSRPAPLSTLRPALYATSQLLTMVFVYLPLAFGGFAALLTVPEVDALVGPAPWTSALRPSTSRRLPCRPCSSSARSSAAFVLTFTVPRVLNLAIRPDKVYPLYGFHDSLHRTVARLTQLEVLDGALR